MSLTSFLSFATSSPNNMGLVRNELQYVDLPTGKAILTFVHTHTITQDRLCLKVAAFCCCPYVSPWALQNKQQGN